jgi:hypothetical protein
MVVKLHDLFVSFLLTDFCLFSEHRLLMFCNKFRKAPTKHSLQMYKKHIRPK